MEEEDYRGIRNPYHKAVIENKASSENFEKLDEQSLEKTLRDIFKTTFKKNGTMYLVEEDPNKKVKIFDPEGEADETGNWIRHPSPFYSGVEQWWDEEGD